MALVTFQGAVRQVTGSCHLLELQDGPRILLDCGLRQGRREEENANRGDFPFDPKSLDAVVLSHAHLDHSGLVPRLVAAGYHGPIYATPATCELLELMLLDSAHLQERDAEWESRWRARQGKPAVQPLYTVSDAEHSLKHRAALDYGQREQIAPGVTLCFHEAGHILGSAVVELEVQDQGQTRRLVFSGDLGNTCSPLMRAPQSLPQADLVMMESTYGDRNHRCNEDTLDELLAILQAAQKEGGNVLIPSFAVGRTQDLLYYLGHFYQQGLLAQQVVFLDSPMAIRANAIYGHFTDQFNDEQRQTIRGYGAHNLKDWLPILRPTLTPDESMAINRIKSGAIIIAGSGMCNGGRIVHHLKHNLWRHECHIVFPGFQAAGTLGRTIVDGAQNVRILQQRIAVNAKIHTLGGFSAHAGQNQLIDWLRGFKKAPDLHLVHGEYEKMLTLQQAIAEQLGWRANIPEPGEQAAL